MPTELIAQSRDHLVAEAVWQARLIARHQRQREHGSRHRKLHRLLERPASLTRVVDPATQLIQLWIASEGLLGKLEEPRSHHASLIPEMRDGVQVKLAEVLLRLHDGEALRIRLEHAVLDAVMDHLDKMSRTRRSHVQESVGRSQGREDGAPVIDGFLLAAGHEAVPDLQTPDATARSRIDEADAALSAAGRASHGVVIVAVAAVDD